MKQKKAEIDRINNMPCANPRYGGLTVLEAARQFLKSGKQVECKAPTRT